LATASFAGLIAMYARRTLSVTDARLVVVIYYGEEKAKKQGRHKARSFDAAFSVRAGIDAASLYRLTSQTA
jgi:hypothetical protein